MKHLIALSCSLLLVACRGGETASTDAAVDHGYTPPTVLRDPPPRTSAPPQHIGGGPAADDRVYGQQSALNTIAAAYCHRARTCGFDEKNCDGRAAEQHRAVLRCDNGVRAAKLSSCVAAIREASCEGGAPYIETCTPAALCVEP